MKRSSIAQRLCPVARASAQLTDAWTFVILREVFLGNRRFEGLRLHTGMSPRSLALRLAHLVEHDILCRQPCADAPAHEEYRLSPKGLDLWPVMVTLREWGERWAGPWGRGGSPTRLMHRGHEHELRLALHCAECGEPVDAHSGTLQATPAVLRERAAFAAQVAGGGGQKRGTRGQEAPRPAPLKPARAARAPKPPARRAAAPSARG